MNQTLLDFLYLISAVLFFFGFRGLAAPNTARRGNTLAMAGMALAIIGVLVSPQVRDYGFIIPGILIGAVIGVFLARQVAMTAMPQLVAALHSFVGLAAVLVAVGTFFTHRSEGALNFVLLLELTIGSFVGAITLTGSVIAFGKLQGILSGAPLRFAGQHMLNLALAIMMVAFAIHFMISESLLSFAMMIFIALALGILLIIPIGGADMPVVVSMLNSYSGWAAAATGFTLSNALLVITGAFVGSSGAILSYIMCRAMNRSLWNVIFGGFGSAVVKTEAGPQKQIRSAAPEDVAFFMSNASKVIIVPGYGMAVAQAQHAVAELVGALEEKGVEVKFAIHPVAGRMPGHMNVLLAEAKIPYDKVFELEEINAEFSTADVVLVLGANDITNPAAERDPSSPIYGMPILEVYKAKQVFFVKRSMAPGYAGVDNLLFYEDHCSLVFGDAKKVTEEIVRGLRAL